MKFHLPATPRNPRAAYALILVMVFVATSLLVLSGGLDWSASNASLSARTEEYHTTLAATESATTKAIARITEDFKNYGLAQVDASLAAYRLDVPSQNENTLWSDVRFSNASGVLDRMDVTKTVDWQYTNINSQFPGLKGYAATYRVGATARRLNSLFQIKTAVQQDVQLVTIPVFQFGVFYVPELEINPDLNFTVPGRVHCNRTIYVHPNAATVTFQSYVTGSEEILHSQSAADPVVRSGGTVTYQAPIVTRVNRLNLTSGTNSSPLTLHGMIELPPAGESSNSPMGQLRLYNQADVVIRVYDTNVVITSGAYNNFATRLWWTDAEAIAASAPTTPSPDAVLQAITQLGLIRADLQAEVLLNPQANWAADLTSAGQFAQNAINELQKTPPGTKNAYSHLDNGMKKVETAVQNSYNWTQGRQYVNRFGAVVNLIGYLYVDTSPIVPKQTSLLADLQAVYNSNPTADWANTMNQAITATQNGLNELNTVYVNTSDLGQDNITAISKIELAVEDHGFDLLLGSGFVDLLAAIIDEADGGQIMSIETTGLITTNKTFFNKREAKTIQLTELKIKKFNDLGNKIYNFFISKIGRSLKTLYVADLRTQTGNSQPGVRLSETKQLPPFGLTVVTLNPLYVKDHFNCPVAAHQGTTNTTASLPAALIADAVTLLSPDWKDGDSSKALNDRRADHMTVNAAILTGIVPTGGGDYSGGLENLVRLLEDWSSGPRTLTINGSLVALFYSQTATAPWGTFDVYAPPSRRFARDPNFSDPNKLPDKTPQVRAVIRSNWQVAKGGP